MKTSVIALCAAAALSAAPAFAEHNTRTDATLDVDIKVDRDGFRFGGRVFGEGERVLGAWLNGRVTEHGVRIDGRVQGEERAYNFKLNADLLDALRRGLRSAGGRIEL